MAKKSTQSTVVLSGSSSATTYTINPATTLSNISISNPYTYTTMAGNWATGASQPFYTTQPKVQITDSDIELDGLSLRQTLLNLQARLAIMIPNPELETEFDELRRCGDRYRKLEKKFLEQKRVWETLKKTDQ
jgi:hypothetical protein